jgi:hypothetical protein
MEQPHSAEKEVSRQRIKAAAAEPGAREAARQPFGHNGLSGRQLRTQRFSMTRGGAYMVSKIRFTALSFAIIAALTVTAAFGWECSSSV